MSEPETNSNKAESEPRLKRSVAWLVTGLILAAVAGQLFGFVPTRIRLLGLFAIGQGCAVGLLLGRTAIPLKMHYPTSGIVGGFVCGASSVAVTGVVWWLNWAAQMKMPEAPRPDTALAAQMLAQMKEPPNGDAEQQKAYEETRRQMSEYIAEQTAPPKVGFTDWLTHRSSAVTDDRAFASVIGLIEVLLAGVAAGWLTRSAVKAPFCQSCQAWKRVVRSHHFAMPLPEELALLISDVAEHPAATVSVNLSSCDCVTRPVVDLQIEPSGGSPQRELLAVSLGDEQFSTLKRLLDEGQGMN